MSQVVTTPCVVLRSEHAKGGRVSIDQQSCQLKVALPVASPNPLVSN